MRIKSFGIYRLDVLAHETFVLSVLSAVKKNEWISDFCPRHIAALEKAMEEEMALTGVNQIRQLTREIVDMHVLRVHVLQQIKANIRCFGYYPNEEVKKAAKVLGETTKRLGKTYNAQYDELSGRISAILEIFDRDYAAEVQRLELDNQVRMLEWANNEFRARIDARDELASRRPNGALKAARYQTDVCYRDMVMVINASLRTNPNSDKFKPFIAYLNTEIHRYQLMLRRHKAWLDSGKTRAEIHQLEAEFQAQEETAESN